MSQASSLYDSLVTRMTALFPSALRIPNPYDLARNAEPKLRQGWGVAVGAGANTNRYSGCKVSIDRTFTIVLCRKFYGLDSDTSPREDVEQLILEDQITLIRDLETNSTVNGVTALTKFTGDSGIQSLSVEKGQFIYLETAISIELFETL